MIIEVFKALICINSFYKYVSYPAMGYTAPYPFVTSKPSSGGSSITPTRVTVSS
ncbi:hypothetical protein DPMN_040516 [Dreissena polymorpha]|uniref:Uncharacterized protein n=1 Tax=Dreissena polymorpha TaxID=45954 RepID=A0A9D4CXY5_DREPO|nr:hypothetical protein DPMN_040516 [Dreissena polymorpha]